VNEKERRRNAVCSRRRRREESEFEVAERSRSQRSGALRIGTATRSRFLFAVPREAPEAAPCIFIRTSLLSTSSQVLCFGRQYIHNQETEDEKMIENSQMGSGSLSDL